jgi:hypothetical protein
MARHRASVDGRNGRCDRVRDRAGQLSQTTIFSPSLFVLSRMVDIDVDELRTAGFSAQGSDVFVGGCGTIIVG